MERFPEWETRFLTKSWIGGHVSWNGPKWFSGEQMVDDNNDGTSEKTFTKAEFDQVTAKRDKRTGELKVANQANKDLQAKLAAFEATQAETKIADDEAAGNYKEALEAKAKEFQTALTDKDVNHSKLFNQYKNEKLENTLGKHITENKAFNPVHDFVTLSTCFDINDEFQLVPKEDGLSKLGLAAVDSNMKPLSVKDIIKSHYANNPQLVAADNTTGGAGTQTTQTSGAGMSYQQYSQLSGPAQRQHIIDNPSDGPKFRKEAGVE